MTSDVFMSEDSGYRDLAEFLTGNSNLNESSVARFLVRGCFFRVRWISILYKLFKRCGCQGGSKESHTELNHDL